MEPIGRKRMSSFKLRNVLTLSIALTLTGCMVGPDYHRPQVNVPTQYKEMPGWTSAAPADDVPKGDWWAAFNDPLLNELEPQVAVSNQTVAQSYANYQAAMAEVQVARSALFPPSASPVPAASSAPPPVAPAVASSTCVR